MRCRRERIQRRFLRAGLIAAPIVNAHLPQGAPRIEATDFVPWYTPEMASPEQMVRNLERWLGPQPKNEEE